MIGVLETLGRHNINKNRDKPQNNCQGTPHFRTYVLHDLTQCSL